MSSNDPSAQTNISTDRDDEPGSTRVHEGAPAPEEVSVRLRRRRVRMLSTAATANIGVVGLAVMGSNLARNLASREGNTVAIYNRSHAKTETLLTEHPEAGFVPAGTYEEFAASLQQAAHRDHHGQGRQGHGCRHRRAGERVRAGRHHRRRRQRAVHRHHPPREGGPRDRDQLRRRRHLRRRGGRAARARRSCPAARTSPGSPSGRSSARSRRSPRASRASPTSATTAPATS